MSNRNYKIAGPDDEIAVPPEIAVCPYCQSPVSAIVEGWTEAEDGTYTADSVSLDCPNEVGVDEQDPAHDDPMPYVNMLPVVLKVKLWINRTHRFVLD